MRLGKATSGSGGENEVIENRFKTNDTEKLDEKSEAGSTLLRDDPPPPDEFDTEVNSFVKIAYYELHTVRR